VNTIIISDIHLGSDHFLRNEFEVFMRDMPPDCTLVLNGDTVDRWHLPLPPDHHRTLEQLKKESFKRRIVWVRGNHDEPYVMQDPGSIEFKPSHTLGKKLFIGHGYDFDNVTPYNRTFLVFFRMMHRLRVFLGAEPVHVAFYAKRFPRLYRVLRRHVAMNAVEYAKENGYRAVTCGHTHYPEDRVINGIRYVNTGSWTERPACYLQVNAEEMKLKRVPGT